MKWSSFIEFIALSLLLLFLEGCGKPKKAEPIPKTHPAYGFYQIAKNGPTTVDFCESYGGSQIHRDNYEEIENMAEGVFTLREKSTGKKYLGVSFGVGNVLVVTRTCCWEIANNTNR